MDIPHAGLKHYIIAFCCYIVVYKQVFRVSKRVQRYFGNEWRERHRVKTCVYYVENSNMETSLILLVVVGIGAIKYMMSRQVCK